MPTNCVNCGVPFTGSKCQYCGTEYGDASYFTKKQKVKLIKQFLKAPLSTQQELSILRSCSVDAVEYYKAWESEVL